MSDNELDDEKPFFAEKAKTGRAVCKKCKVKCESGELRIARMVANPFGSGKLKHWYHVDCMFEQFDKQRATTKRIESSDDIDGWSQLNDLDRDVILEKIKSLPTMPTSTAGAAAASSSTSSSSSSTTIKRIGKDGSKTMATASTSKKIDDDNLKLISNQHSADNLFSEFRRICADVSNESSYLEKTKVLHKFFVKGANNKKFEGDLYLWMKFLLPNAEKRIYNVQSKQLVKIFGKIFNSDHTDMMEHLEQGDVSETISHYFDKSKYKKKLADSTLTLNEVDEFLDQLSDVTREEDQVLVFSKICKKCTGNDMRTIIRLIKRDLRINSGAKHILASLSPDAFEAFQLTRDLKNVVEKFSKDISSNVIAGGSSPVKKGTGVRLMCPISPMLAEACKSVEKAIAKYPQGFYSEIKYDGERVQLHKQGNEFKFFSRNLKPVSDHKINRCEEFIPKAFPSANDLILDSEILMVNTKTGELLPFGTLGKHKKTQFDSAEVCLFIFDCIYYNGEDLTKRPLKERRKILEENICPIKNHVQLSEYQFITSSKELKKIIAEVLQKGLEGLVLKSINGLYEPGKRHWLKVKKDYLFDGKMADTADLVVLGGWFGTGRAGGMLSIFLMGCYDKKPKIWKTVTKVHSGLDDKTMEELQVDFKKLMVRCNVADQPKWLSCKKSMLPDYIAVDPSKMPVWEITGAEFSKSDIHTADGISIRFPRITRFRDDKSPETATNLDELKTLFRNSKDNINLKLLTSDDVDDDDNNDSGMKTKAAMAGPSSLVKTTVKNESKRNIKVEKNVQIKKMKKEQSYSNSDDEDESKPPIADTKYADNDNNIDADGGGDDDDEHKPNLNLGEKLNNKKRYYNRDSVKKEKISDDDDGDDGDNKMIIDDNVIIDEKLKIKLETSQDIKLKHNTSDNDDNDDVDNNDDNNMYQHNKQASPLAPNKANTKIIPKSENKLKKMKYLFDENTSSGGGGDGGGDAENSNGDNNSDTDADDGDDSRIDEDNKKIFDGIKLFITTNDVYDSLRNDIKVFQMFGGRLTNKSQNCNYALHENDFTHEDISSLRQKYSPLCRHVKKNWLPECVIEKKMLDVQNYPVTLKYER